MELHEAVTAAVGALGAIAATLYGVKRKIAQDTNSDRLDGKATQIIERLEAQLDQEIERAEKLTAAIDRVSSERNEAVQQVGRMDATIHALEKEVERLRIELQSVEQANQALIEQAQGMSAKLTDVTNKIDGLMRINEQLITIIQQNHI